MLAVNVSYANYQAALSGAVSIGQVIKCVKFCWRL